MQTIKFSHKYTKMPDDLSDTRLLEVFNTSFNKLGTLFKSYDTMYDIKGIDGIISKFYKLPNSDLIVLLLISSGVLWTTIRRWTSEKEAYYRTLRGHQVKIEVRDDSL